jgi:hypothetical protein
MGTSLRPQSEALLLLASLLVSGSFGQLATLQRASEGLLKYELSDVFVGNLKHTIRLENPSYSTARGMLLVPLIRNETARHYVIISNFSSAIGQPKLVTDNSENLYAVWNNVEISREGHVAFETNCLVLSFATQYQIDTNYSVNYDKSFELYRKYTQPEDLIQSNDPEIVQKARNVTSNANTTSAKASRIYDFVVKHIHYAAQDEERGALWALEKGAGDCSEYSYLFIALCRASGIPARAKAGFAFHYSSETMEDGHMWAEYYLGDYGWVPVDATWNLFNTIDYRHFSSIQGTLEDMPYANYVFNGTTGIIVEEAQTVTLKPASMTVFGNNFFAENLTNAVQKTEEAKLALFFGGLLGSAWIFPTETEKAQESISECNLLLQRALEQLDPNPIGGCIEKAQEITQKAWTTVIVTTVLCIGFTVLVVVAALAVTTRRRITKRAKTI